MNQQESKPVVKLQGENGNVFSIIARTRRALIDAGLPEQAEQFVNEATHSESYDAVLQLVFTYCDVV